MIWKPDTCTCVLEYNGTNSPANFVRAINRCADHAADVDSSMIVTENVSKNQVLDKLAAVQKLQRTVTDAKGAQSIELDDTKIAWSFDKNRNLVIDAPDLTPLEKVAVLVELKKVTQKVAIN